MSGVTSLSGRRLLSFEIGVGQKYGITFSLDESATVVSTRRNDHAGTSSFRAHFRRS
jgi:hypothetical protein